ncbi:unnamed protein product [Sphenostylis stenocarpa]|uniref:Uncharacterized protein n=1 Tax=Sphenostylis stenocarpa TaxID=92480 RepID=A0AA86SYY1_9FABA|nr:unnamed protein product [Sphenostylis stenocarpa]
MLRLCRASQSPLLTLAAITNHHSTADHCETCLHQTITSLTTTTIGLGRANHRMPSKQVTFPLVPQLSQVVSLE